jgi:hypothetical protein
VAAHKAVPEPFQDPKSDAVDSVNPYVLCCWLCCTSLIAVYSLIVNGGGDSPNGSGGMVPSTAPPFAMTHWVAQTCQNYVSMTPYRYLHTWVSGERQDAEVMDC